MDGREVAHEHGRLREAENRAQDGQQRQEGHKLVPGDSGDGTDARDGEQRSDDSPKAQALLALRNGEQQRRQGHESEERLSEPGVDPDEGVVGEREGSAEDERPVEQHADERSPARTRQPEDGHHTREEPRREHEANACAPERVELTVAEPDADRVSACEHCAGDERRERGPFTRELHE